MGSASGQRELPAALVGTILAYDESPSRVTPTHPSGARHNGAVLGTYDVHGAQTVRGRGRPPICPSPDTGIPHLSLTLPLLPVDREVLVVRRARPAATPLPADGGKGIDKLSPGHRHARSHVSPILRSRPRQAGSRSPRRRRGSGRRSRLWLRRRRASTTGAGPMRHRITTVEAPTCRQPQPPHCRHRRRRTRGPSGRSGSGPHTGLRRRW